MFVDVLPHKFAQHVRSKRVRRRFTRQILHVMYVLDPEREDARAIATGHDRTVRGNLRGGCVGIRLDGDEVAPRSPLVFALHRHHVFPWRTCRVKGVYGVYMVVYMVCLEVFTGVYMVYIHV